MHIAPTTPFTRTACLGLMLLAGSATTSAGAQEVDRRGVISPVPQGSITFRESMPAEMITNLRTGEVVEAPAFRKSKYLCGSDETGLTVDDLRAAVAQADAIEANAENVTVINTPRRGGGIDVIFNIQTGSTQAQRDAVALAEQAIEATFLDQSTIVCNLSFTNLGNGGVLGFASSNSNNFGYEFYRVSLVGDQDSDDSIESSLPVGSIPIIYNFNNLNSVTNETTVELNDANQKSVGFNSSGSDVSITINTLFNFDTNPENGISAGQTSLVDVLIHEVGHGMGFISNADDNITNPVSLDLYRFSRLDSGQDLNPDTLAEFTTTPRVVDFDNPSPDNSISDIISNEWRMSDGNPFQASHFREQGSNIGLMDPAISANQTFFPRGYYSFADLAMFDAIGYDFVDTQIPIFQTQPNNISGCVDDLGNINLTAVAAGNNITYQWFRDGSPLAGENSTSLQLGPADPSLNGSYFCRATNALGSDDSSVAVVDIDTTFFVQDVQDVTVTEGDDAVFDFVINGPVINTVWSVNDGIDGIQFGGETFTIAAAPLSLDGAEIQVQVTGECGLIASRRAVLTVEPDTAEPCLPDVNNDGELNGADFNAWLNAFSAGLPAADQNQDGQLNGADFNAWLANFTDGCP